jgi:two-component system, response regulator PdtaR
MARYKISKEIVGPDDVLMLAAIYLQIVQSSWFTSDRIARDAFAGYVIEMFQRGLVDPERLKAVCLEAAKSKFNKIGSVPRPQIPTFLIVEGDFFIAVDMASTLVRSGARVMGPTASARDALDLLRKARRHPDGAFLDMSLPDDDVVLVADRLAESGIPFAFVAGDDDWLPARFLHAPCFVKTGNVKELSVFALACRDAWSLPFGAILQPANNSATKHVPRRLQ